MHFLSSDESKIEMLAHSGHYCFKKKKGEACKPRNTIPNVKNASCCVGLLLQKGVVHFKIMGKKHDGWGKCVETSYNISQKLKLGYI